MSKMTFDQNNYRIYQKLATVYVFTIFRKIDPSIYTVHISTFDPKSKSKSCCYNKLLLNDFQDCKNALKLITHKNENNRVLEIIFFVKSVFVKKVTLRVFLCSLKLYEDDELYIHTVCKSPNETFI